MEFKLEIACDNAAFEDNMPEEVARILREAATKVETGWDEIILKDHNGNTVGKAKFRET